MYVIRFVFERMKIAKHVKDQKKNKWDQSQLWKLSRQSTKHWLKKNLQCKSGGSGLRGAKVAF